MVGSGGVTDLFSALADGLDGILGKTLACHWQKFPKEGEPRTGPKDPSWEVLKADVESPGAPSLPSFLGTNLGPDHLLWLLREHRHAYLSGDMFT